MSKSTDRIVDAQNAILETAESVGVRALEGAVELLQLNLQAAHLAASATSDIAKASASSARHAGASATGQFDASRAFAYQRRAWDIMVRASADVTPMLAQQMRQFQTLYGEMASVTLSRAPAANGPWSALVRSPFEVVQKTLEQTSEAMARAATSAAESVDSVVNQVEESAPRARKAA
jgi:hypothetical protein